MAPIAFYLLLLLQAQEQTCDPAEISVRVTVTTQPKGRIGPPIVTITDAAGRVHQPARKGDLLCFAGVPAGKATLKLTGDRWLTVEETFDAKPGATRSVTAIATTKLVVNWWTPNDITAMTKPVAECGKLEQKVEPFAATLFVCPGGDPSATIAVAQAPNCRQLEPRPLSDTGASGRIVFADIPAGAHLIRFTAGSGEPVFRTVRAYANEATEEHVEARWTTIYGKVTKKGDPFHGRVFESAITDPETGSYIATVPRLPVNPAMSVQPCDGSQTYWFVVDPQPVENAAYDIEIPANRLDVDVVDAASGQPIKGVRVTYSVPRDGKTSGNYFSMTGGRSDEQGRVSISPLVAKRNVKVCGRHDDYDWYCSDPFKLTATEEKRVRMPLTKVEKRTGRVFTPGKSFVFWQGASGLSERVVTDEEGRFSYKSPHVPGEIVSVSSAAGFFVTVHPELEKDEIFEIRPPQARLRTFALHLAPTSTDEFGFFTITLGDLIVAPDALADHAFRTEQQGILKPGWTTVIANVFETAPISVIYAPKSFAESRMPNWWMRPEARTLPRRALGEQSRVVFD